MRESVGDLGRTVATEINRGRVDVGFLAKEQDCIALRHLTFVTGWQIGPRIIANDGVDLLCGCRLDIEGCKFLVNVFGVEKVRMAPMIGLTIENRVELAAVILRFPALGDCANLIALCD